LPHKVRIKELRHLAEFEKLLDIQRAVWGHNETDLTPPHLFRVHSHLGAIIIGAYVGKEIAGFVYSFPAVHNEKCCLHSHQLAVLPKFQGLGIGKLLKNAQRDEAVKRGFDLITWTFDPMGARNANLNLHALGAIARTYLPDFYGRMPALWLGPDIPTDRLLIEWPVRKARPGNKPEETGKGDFVQRTAKALERKDPLNPLSYPGRSRLGLADRIVLVEILRDVRSLTRKPGLVAAWQKALRRVLKGYFARGYRAVDFIFGDRVFYVLKKP
jgi:predicted GNAT superfamily acetyltransferase